MKVILYTLNSGDLEELHSCFNLVKVDRGGIGQKFTPTKPKNIKPVFSVTVTQRDLKILLLQQVLPLKSEQNSPGSAMPAQVFNHLDHIYVIQFAFVCECVCCL